MKLTGTWVGEYRYPADPQDPDGPGADVPFRMSVTESWRGRIGGYVRDDASRGGMPERGRVRGRRTRADVEFVKTMPKIYVVDDDGELADLRDVLHKGTGEAWSGEIPPARIRYSGSLADDGMSARGVWEIDPLRLESAAGAVELVGSSGTWSMRRVSDLVDEV